MGIRVVYRLNTNFVGVVKDGDFVLIPDFEDLTAKADQSYVDKIESNIKDKIKEEKRIRILSQETINEVLANKADKDTVAAILSESTLENVKTDIEFLFTSHVESIHEACVRERLLIIKEIAGFREFAAELNDKAATKFNPVNESFRDLDSKIDRILDELPNIKSFQIKFDEVESKLNIFTERLNYTDELIVANKETIDKIIEDQIAIQLPLKVNTELEKMKSEHKSKGFFKRLFG